MRVSYSHDALEDDSGTRYADFELTYAHTMACGVPHPPAATLNADDGDDSDYGPDFTSEEQELLNALFENITAGESSGVALNTPAASEPTPATEVGVLGVPDIEDVVTGLSETQGRSPFVPDINSKKGIGYRVG